MVRRPSADVIDTGEFFLPNLSVAADYFAANALINSYIACDAAMPVIWA